MWTAVVILSCLAGQATGIEILSNGDGCAENGGYLVSLKRGVVPGVNFNEAELTPLLQDCAAQNPATLNYLAVYPNDGSFPQTTYRSPFESREKLERGEPLRDLPENQESKAALIKDGNTVFSEVQDRRNPPRWVPIQGGNLWDFQVSGLSVQLVGHHWRARFNRPPCLDIWSE